MWDVSEAAVACRQLGYRYTGEIIDFVPWLSQRSKASVIVYIMYNCSDSQPWYMAVIH